MPRLEAHPWPPVAPSFRLGAVIEHSREVMRTGSLSFFFASRFLAPPARDAVRLLYTWCRYCDDIVDRAGQATSVAQRTMILDELRRKTWAAVHGHRQGSVEPAFAALAALVRQCPFPESYLQELLTGMDMDIAGQRYETFADLKVYCYRVAGVVGLMFGHINGVSGARALEHAADLGMAMQMTNIARDVLEDQALGRLYLPRDWLSAEGLTEQTAFLPENRDRLALVAARLLAEAERHYQSGDCGLQFLPARTAFAVAVARHVYAAIGSIIRRRAGSAWECRAVVPLSYKIALLTRSVRSVIQSRRVRG